MRLFKMAAYALLGYAIYEFVRGMLEEPGLQSSVAHRQPQSTKQSDLGNSFGTPAARTS